MPYPLELSDFERGDVLRAQQIEWKVERIAWLIIALLLGMAMLGGFGGGPLAHATRSASSVQLEFDHLVRHSVPTRLMIQVGPEAVIRGRFLVSLDWKFVRAVDFRDVRPTPVGSVSHDGRLTFEFAAPFATEPGPIVLEIEHQQTGRQVGFLSVGDGPALEFEQLVFP
jgi:hypothetical protein